MHLSTVVEKLGSVYTDPLANPLPIFHNPEHHGSKDLWRDVGEASLFALDALSTATLRLTAPLVVSYGLAKHYGSQKTAASTLAAIAAVPFGLLAGVVTGASGIVVNAGQAAFGIGAAAAFAAAGGVEALKVRTSADSSQQSTGADVASPTPS